MVWNVTKDDITVRMAVTEERTWSPPLAAPTEAPKQEDRTAFADSVGLPSEAMEFSEFVASGFDDVDDVLRPIYEEASEALGQEFPYPGDN